MKTFPVNDMDGLRQAAALSVIEDLRITLGTFPAVPGVVLGAPGRVTVLQGGCLDYSAYQSKWAGGTYDPAGLLVQSTVSKVQDVGFLEYNGSSAPLKFEVPRDGDVSVDGCSFLSVGTEVLPANGAGVRFRTCCVECHRPPQSFVARDNTFRDCCTNDESLSHCWYVSGDSVVLRGNDYMACGNPWGVYGTRLTIAGEYVWDPALCWDAASGTRVPPRILIVRNGQPPMTFLGNTVAGEVSWFAWGKDLPRGVFRNNDYFGMEARAMAWDYGRGVPVSREEWEARGLDVAPR